MNPTWLLIGKVNRASERTKLAAINTPVESQKQRLFRRPARNAGGNSASITPPAANTAVKEHQSAKLHVAAKTSQARIEALRSVSQNPRDVMSTEANRSIE
jgi:hypothetical protein